MFLPFKPFRIQNIIKIKHRKLSMILMVKKLYSAMEIDLKTRVALWFRRRLHRRKSSGKAVKLSSSKDKLRSILFFLPDKIEHIRIVEYFIKSISLSELYGIEFRFLCSQIAGTGYLKLINTGIQMYNEEGLDQWLSLIHI